MHVYVLIRSERGMNKCCCDISLGKNEIHTSSQHYHGLDSGPLNNQSPGFKEVNTLYLPVATNAETSFKLLNEAVGELFEAKGPCVGKNVHPGLTWNEFPCSQIRFQGCQLRLHSVPPFFSMRTVDGLSVSGIIGDICCGLSGEDMGLNVSDGKGSHFVREIWLEVGRKRQKGAIADRRTKAGPIALKESQF